MLFWKDHAYISFDLRNFTFSTGLMKEILWVGIPSSISMIIMSFGQGIFNYILVDGYGPDAVAAYTISGRLDMLMFLPIMGIATGRNPQFVWVNLIGSTCFSPIQTITIKDPHRSNMRMILYF